MDNACAYEGNDHACYAKQPVHIICGGFRCTLFTTDKFLEIPIDKIPLLWGPMLKAASENRTSIELIANWLVEEEANIKGRISFLENELKLQNAKTEAARRTVAVFGSVAREEHIKAYQDAEKQQKKLANAIKSANGHLNKVLTRQKLFEKMF